MKPIAKQKILQIEITNACPHRCSNCTRFSGHHKRPFFMDLETVERALDSLRTFPGMIGIMGGEPTIHPRFEEIAELAAKKIPQRRGPRGDFEPIRDFTEYRNRRLAAIPGRKLGLWSSLGEGYYRHFETIQDVFAYQCINTHDNPGLHQGILVASSELPIPAEERRRLIDDCWVNRLWSASITPKGAFFCEVAAALDMLFDGPGGWDISPQWWRRPISEWGDQLRWCELCGAAMPVPRRPAWDEKDDVSPGNFERLLLARSPKALGKRVDVFDVGAYDRSKYGEKASAEWYLPEGDNRKRVGTDRSLFPRKIEALLVCVGYADFLAYSLPTMLAAFDRVVVVTASKDSATQALVCKLGADLVVSDVYHSGGSSFNKGKMINAGAAKLDFDDWVMITDADILFPPGYRKELDRLILNPGCLHYGTRVFPESGSVKDWLARWAQDPGIVGKLRLADPSSNQRPWGYHQLFNVRAKAIRDRGRELYSEKFASAGGVDYHFHSLWPAKKKIHLRDARFRLVHIPHGDTGTNWNGRISKAIDPAYVPFRTKAAGNGWRNIGWISSGIGFKRSGPTPRRGFLRLIRYDTSDYVVTPFSRGRGASWINGKRSHGALHVGIISDRFLVEQNPAKNRGRIIIHHEGGREWSGYGLGHVMYEDNRQGFVWAGVEIPETDLDVAWKAELDEEDLEHLQGRSQ